MFFTLYHHHFQRQLSRVWTSKVWTGLTLGHVKLSRKCIWNLMNLKASLQVLDLFIFSANLTIQECNDKTSHEALFFFLYNFGFSFGKCALWTVLARASPIMAVKGLSNLTWHSIFGCEFIGVTRLSIKIVKTWQFSKMVRI